MSALEKEIYIREDLGFDFINIHQFPKTLLRYAEDGYPVYQSPYGDIFKETPHSFQIVKPALEDIEYVENYQTMDLVAQLADKMMAFEIGRTKLFLDKGADAILITDDIAFNTGLLLPPETMKEVAYPFYKNAKAMYWFDKE